MRKADSKLVFIPMVFVLLRLWGTVQFFYLLAVPLQIERCTCIEGTGYYHGLIFLGTMQARTLYSTRQFVVQ